MRPRLLVVLAALALAAATSASAANQPHPTLDAIATEVTGYPATVWCENSAEGWAALRAGGPGARGFVRWPNGAALPEPTAYIAPWDCLPLLDGLAYRDQHEPELLGQALLTLLHESVHLSGVRDEAAADCAALALVKSYAIRYFGFTATVTQKRRVLRWSFVKRKVWVWRNGERLQVVKRVRVRVTRVVSVRVANPRLKLLYKAAFTRHLGSPSEYQGDC